MTLCDACGQPVGTIIWTCPHPHETCEADQFCSTNCVEVHLERSAQGRPG